MTIVTVIGHVLEEGLSLLRARPGTELRLLQDPSAEKVMAAMPGADAIIVRTFALPGEAIDAAVGLRIVSKHGVGYDNIDVAACNRRHIPVSVTPMANAVSVAEHTLFMILELLKHGRAFDAGMKQGGWAFARDSLPTELAGKTVLVAGYGRISSRVVRMLLAFDARVLVADPFVAPELIEAAGAEPSALARALPQADIVTLHCPLTDKTRHMIDAAALAAMKPGAILVNTARGGLIDELALAQALASGGIAAAGLDAFAQEPPPADHPLLKLGNALVSPHMAGVTREAAVRMGVEAAENVLAALDGRLDRSVVVNPQVLAPEVLAKPEAAR